MNSWRGWGSKNDFECPPLCSGHIQRKEYFIICSSGKSADFPELPFHGWGRKGRWHICRLPGIPLCESWIQKRPQAFLNPKFKMKFLNLWPKRTRRPFQIVLQGLAHRGSFLAKTKIGACRWSSCTSRFCFLCVGCGTKHSRCRAGSSRANRAAASRRKEKGMEEWSGALADAPFSGATRLELANHRCENRIPQSVSLVNP